MKNIKFNLFLVSFLVFSIWVLFLIYRNESIEGEIGLEYCDNKKLSIISFPKDMSVNVSEVDLVKFSSLLLQKYGKEIVIQKMETGAFHEYGNSLYINVPDGKLQEYIKILVDDTYLTGYVFIREPCIKLR